MIGKAELRISTLRLNPRIVSPETDREATPPRRLLHNALHPGVSNRGSDHVIPIPGLTPWADVGDAQRADP